MAFSKKKTKSTKKYNFKEGLLRWQVWTSSFAYHLLVLFLNWSIPRQTMQTIDGIVSGKNIISIFPKLLINISLGQNLIFFINLVIFESIFTLMFVLYNRSNKKYYNYLGVFAVGLATSIIFQLYARIVFVNLVR